MCMEDVKIGRAAKSRPIVNSTGNALVTIPGNADRIALIISGSAVDTFYLGRSISGTQNVADLFIQTQNNSPVVLRVEDYGDWLLGQLFFVNQTNTGAYAIMETYLDRSVS